VKSPATCRFCAAPLEQVFVDLGVSPLANSFIEPDRLRVMEPFFPLVVFVCGRCFLVQLEEFESPEGIFSEYSYFSSYSDTWLEHCRRYAEAMTRRWNLGAQSKVVEIASNDGYLLQYFKAGGVPVLGVEPAANVAKVAESKGIPTAVLFFGAETAVQLAKHGHQADLIAANNVLAHVPDVNSFVRGFKTLLKPGGVITVEFPHFLNLIEQNQFDTIYHEHFSYLTLAVADRIFRQHGLRVFDVEELPTHGGSLRIYGCHDEDAAQPTLAAVTRLRKREQQAGLETLETYRRFQPRVTRVKVDLLKFLIAAYEEKKAVIGYGAPAKGNTLLNFCGVGKELLQYTADRSPHKAGRYLPGCRIPIFAPEHIRETRPDYVLILPWTLKEEITAQLAFVRDWGARFVTAVPDLRVF
jgi:2-polyprenyl-3-methyl-5-hydroxy-6-metoxy-1,4-benzoquinol methylase